MFRIGGSGFQRAKVLSAAIVVATLMSSWSQRTAAAEPPSAAAPSNDATAVAQGRRLLRAISELDDAAFLSVLHELYPSSRMTDAQWLDVRPNWRQFAFHGADQVTSTHAELSVFDQGREDWVRISITVDPAAPHAITDFALHAGRRPADVPAPPKLAPAALIAATRATVATEAQADRFSGVVLVSRSGRMLLEQAYGLADRPAQRPMSVDSKLRIGSMGKMFTTVAVLQLAQAGKLDLAAPIGRYLPDYPNREVAATVTIDDLLNHAGGTGDIFGPEFDSNQGVLVDPKDYVALFGPRPALFAAGTQQAYSNFGFMILGRLVEAVSGQTYDRYVQDHIFRPARMTGSGFLPETVQVPGRVTGYTGAPGGLTATKNQVFRGTPAGGGYSTGPDLMRFADAVMGGRLLGPAYLARLTTTGTTLPNGVVSLRDFGDHHTGEGLRFLGHGGAAPGQNGVMHIFPDSGYTVVVIANRDPPIAERIAKFIESRIP